MFKSGMLAMTLLMVTAACPETEEDVVSNLADQLNDDDPYQAATAAQALAKMGHAAAPAIGDLIEALADTRDAGITPKYFPVPREIVGSCAANALAAIGSPAVPALADALGTRDEGVRLRAMSALRAIGAPAKSVLPRLRRMIEQEESDSLRFYSLDAYCAIGADDESVPKVLQSALRDSSPEIRGLAAQELGDLGQAAAVAIDDLIAMLSDEALRARALTPDFATERAVRYDAAEALGKIGPAAKKARGRLTALMVNDPDAEVRVSAALAVFRIDGGNAEAMNALIASLKDDGEGTAGPQEAAKAFQQLGPRAAPALPALVEALNHMDEFIRSSSVRAIAAIGSPEAFTAVRSMIDDDREWMRLDAVEALGDLGPAAAPAVPELIEFATGRDENTDFWVKREAVRTLGKIGPGARSAVPELQKLAASDEDEYVRELANEAIERITREK